VKSQNICMNGASSSWGAANTDGSPHMVPAIRDVVSVSRRTNVSSRQKTTMSRSRLGRLTSFTDKLFLTKQRESRSKK